MMDETILNSIIAVIEKERNFIANAANLSAIFYEKVKDINWVGFYFVGNSNILKLGPFQGKVACISIEKGKGVCGCALEQKQSILVEDVHQFPGHIPCDEASNSELVVPIIKDNIAYGVFDIDSPMKSRFSQNDLLLCEEIVSKYLEFSDIEKVHSIYD